jgi:D-alanine-D-alanine ligase
MTHKKLCVGVIFGSRSCEYEVSLHSATSVITYLDKDKYEVIPLGITKEGSWLLGVEPTQLLAAEKAKSEIENLERTRAIVLAGDPNVRTLLPLQDGKQINMGTLDVIFPVLHGPYGEDGTIQGLLEMADIPYVGCGVLGSALGMDKEKMKMIFRAVDLPIVESLTYQRRQWERSPAMIIHAIEHQLGYPCVVKPVNLGSSIGVSWVNNREAFIQAMGVAAEYDSKIIIERGLNIRELSCGVLGNDEPIASYVGELVTEETLLDYSAKYIHHGFHFVVPADIPPSLAEELRRMSIQAFLALDLSGLARVDFFLDRDSGQIYLNEVNTMPGFTEASVYPKLWQASGLPYQQLLDRLIELALERHEDRRRNRTSW